MQRLIDIPAGSPARPKEIIEIKLWEVYLVMNRTNLYHVLTASSIDQGPVEKGQQEPGRVVFRYTATEWEKNIKHLLHAHRIPVIATARNYFDARTDESRILPG